MTVKELIAELSKYPEDLRVFIREDNPDEGVLLWDPNTLRVHTANKFDVDDSRSSLKDGEQFLLLD